MAWLGSLQLCIAEAPLPNALAGCEHAQLPSDQKHLQRNKVYQTMSTYSKEVKLPLHTFFLQVIQSLKILSKDSF